MGDGYVRGGGAGDERRYPNGELIPVVVAATRASRLRGLIGQSDFEGILLIPNCRDIHTFWLQRPIDVAFVDAWGTVLATHRNVPPRRRLRCRTAAAVLERFACDDPWPIAGDRFE